MQMYDDEEFVSEADIAYGEGFYLDDDGNWIPMDDDEVYDFPGLYNGMDDEQDDDTCEDSDCVNEIDFARGEGFYVDDDGNWIPMDDDSELPL